MQVRTKLLSLSDSLNHLSSKLQNLQSQRITLQDLLAKATSLENREHSQKRPNLSVGASIQRNDISTTQNAVTDSLSALLTHLDLSSPENKTTLHNQILAQADAFQSQSAEHISHVLSTLEAAAIRRGQALEDIQACLAGTNDTSELTALEQAINNARAEMEGRV